MNPIILPLSKIVIDEKALMSAAKDAVDKKLKSSERRDDARYVSLLNQLFNPIYGGSTNDVTNIRYHGTIPLHLFYGFLVCASHESYIALILSTLKALSFSHVKSLKDGIDVFIVSGTLLDWKNSIVLCSSPDMSYDIRFITNYILDHFDSLGLGPLFSAFSRKQHKDGTLLLEYKK